MVSFIKMGKQRKSTSEKFKNWQFPFKNSPEDCQNVGNNNKKTIGPLRLRSSNSSHRFEASHGPSSSSSVINSGSKKSKKVTWLTNKCHAVGLTGHVRSLSTSEIQVHNNKNDDDHNKTPKDDDDNETYALISDCLPFETALPQDHNTTENEPFFQSKSHPPLRPLYFEVPQEEEHQLVERSWVYENISDIFSNDKNTRGVILYGNLGTGKTTIALQLVENSCFGRNVKKKIYSTTSLTKLALKIVAYHFCQVDNRTTCLVSDFVHSIAAQMCQAPNFSAYRILLEENPSVQELLSTQNCLIDPKSAFIKGIMEPLVRLRAAKKLLQDYYILILDSIDEAESHRPGNSHYQDYGDTITSFLSKQVLKIPSWFKIIVTIRSNQAILLDLVPFKSISLDIMDDNIDGDVRQYVSTRLEQLVSGSKKSGKKVFPTIVLPGLKTHLLQLSGGCFLFLKLSIDLIEQGHLVVKPNTFKGLPTSLQEVFLLHCNLRFPTTSLFNAVSPILSTCLVVLNPLNLLEIYHSVNSLRFKDNLPWVEFLRLFKSLQGLLVKRLDSTYMFFHSSFRDWLLGKDVGNSKFQCSPELGHAAIALRLLRVERPLTIQKVLDLSHHLLKTKSLRSFAILLLSGCENISLALCSPANIYKTNLKVSRLLLLAGANPSCLIESCANQGNLPLLSLLFEFGTDINYQTETGDSILHLASRAGHLSLARSLLLDHGACPTLLNSKMECPLVSASLSEQISILDLFLELDDDDFDHFWNNSNYSKQDAILHSLVAACAAGCVSSVAHLLSSSKCPPYTLSSTFKGITPLIAAIQQGQYKVVKLLLLNKNVNINVNARDETGTPPLIHAVQGAYYNILDMLLSHQNVGGGGGGVDVNATDINGKTPLIHAVARGDIISAESLINVGRCDMNKRDKDGLSALSWACLSGNAKMTLYLVQYSGPAAVAMGDSDRMGRGPLHIAVSSRQQDVVQTLLDANAPLEQTDFQGNRPLDYAAEFPSPEIVKILLAKGTKLGATVWQKAANNSAILLVLFNKLLEDGKFLLQNGQVSEAKHRFQYALRKLEDQDDDDVVENDAGELCQRQELKNKFLLEMLKCQKTKTVSD